MQTADERFICACYIGLEKVWTLSRACAVSWWVLAVLLGAGWRGEDGRNVIGGGLANHGSVGVTGFLAI